MPDTYDAARRPLREDLAPQFRERFREAEESAPEATPPPDAAWADALLRDAARQEATDIHLNPELDAVEVRFRIDGTLTDVARLDREAGQRLIRQIKTLADLDPVTTFRPLTGRRAYEIEDATLYLRLSTTPTIVGEKLAVRILNLDTVYQDINTLGLTAEQVAELTTWLGSVTGMSLVTGPTGSGKTTTVYTMLHQLRMTDRSVATVEDPAEYHVRGVTQTQVDPRHGLTFAEGLRAMLRLDPDYLLIGEVRDRESAHAAVEAASSGRALMSTLQGRDAVGAVTTLRNHDLRDHEIATVLELVVAQRLVRTLCPECRRVEPPRETEAHWLRSLGLPVPESTWHAVGCDACRHLGYTGRTGVFEVWRLDARDYHLILEHTPERELREDLAERGHRTLLTNGLAAVARGTTTLDELRVLGTFYVPPHRTAAGEALAHQARAVHPA